MLACLGPDEPVRVVPVLPPRLAQATRIANPANWRVAQLRTGPDGLEIRAVPLTLDEIEYSDG